MSCSRQYYDEFDDDKNTKLHDLAARDQIEEIKPILEAGCKVDSENFLGWTPLMMAARNGNFQIVQLLIEHKADATRRNAYGANVFLMSIASGNIDLVGFILQHLLRGGVSKQSMETIISPYTIALLFDHSHIVNYLLMNSFNVNASAPLTGFTPVMFAAVQNNVQLFNLLISAGANPLVKNANGQSAGDIMDMNIVHPPTPSLVEQPRQNCNHLRPEDQFHHRKRSSNKKSQQRKEDHKPDCPASIMHQFPHNNQQCNRRCKDTVICQDPDHHHHHHNDHHLEAIHIPHFYSPQVHRPVPMVYLSPQPMVLNQHSSEMHHHRPRKSSGVSSHWCLMSPSFSPIMPSYNFAPQIFFPSDFNSGAVMSPLNPYAFPDDNSMLNHNVFQSPTNFMGYFPYNTDIESPHV